jgi:hypothetical protein
MQTLDPANFGLQIPRGGGTNFVYCCFHGSENRSRNEPAFGRYVAARVGHDASPVFTATREMQERRETICLSQQPTSAAKVNNKLLLVLL